MPFDAEPDIEAEWAAFKSYLCKPYAANPERAAEIAHWFDELYARRDNEKIELSYYLAEHETSGEKFHVFCLNGQIYFSDNAAIRSLPHPRASGDTENFSDRKVGIWLYDHGPLDDTIKATIAADLAKISNREPQTRSEEGEDYIRHRYASRNRSPLVKPGAEDIDGQPYVAKIVDTINSSTGMKGNANFIDTRLGIVDLRVARNNPRGSGWHRDISKKDGAYPIWGRVIVAGLDSQTAFATDSDQKTVIASPPRTTTSICYATFPDAQPGWGIPHHAIGDENGRSNVAMATRSTPITGEPSPWWLTPAKLGAPVPA